MPSTVSPEVSTSRSEKPTWATKSPSSSSTAAANAGSSTSRRLPMPAHCEPWPEYRKTVPEPMDGSLGPTTPGAG